MDNESSERHFLAFIEQDTLRDEDESEFQWITFDALALGESELESSLLAFRAKADDLSRRYPLLLDGNLRWVIVLVSSKRAGEDLPGEVLMFGDSEQVPEVGIRSIETLPQNFQHPVMDNAMMRGFPQAPASLIAGVLDLAIRDAGPLALAAYDVGQGNCNAVVDEYEHPRNFFDLGWAPNFHAKTRPAVRPGFIVHDLPFTPPVILSHWDMDHWSYAIASSRYNQSNLTTKHEWNPDAIRRFWIARAPQILAHEIGPLHQAFLRALVQTSILPGLSAFLLWPEKKKRISFGAGWVEACSPRQGSRGDRNNTGLVMFVRPNSAAGAIVLTGDADFGSISSLRNKRKPALAGVVAPHHGARISIPDVPKPKIGSPRWMVVSVGSGNSYGHPKESAISAYKKAGWRLAYTFDRKTCEHNGSTHDNGNQLLRFTRSDEKPQCGCGAVPNSHLCLRNPSVLPLDLKQVQAESSFTLKI